MTVSKVVFHDGMVEARVFGDMVCITVMGDHVHLSFEELAAVARAVADFLESAAEPPRRGEGLGLMRPDLEGEGWLEDPRRPRCFPYGPWDP